MYFDKYQFDGLLVAVFLALLPVSSVLSNASGQEPKTVETEIVQRKGYPMHQFHTLPGADRPVGYTHESRPEQIAELVDLDTRAPSLKV